MQTGLYAIRRFFRVAAIAALASASLLHAQDSSDCNLIITSGLRNYNISSSSSSALNVIYNNYCSSSGNTSVDGTKAGLNAVIEEIPIGLTFGQSDQKTAFQNFCKNYQSTAQSAQSGSDYQSTIVTKAYDAFNQCINLHNNGVTVKHNVINLAASSFFLSASIAHPLAIFGVTTSDNVTCSGQDSSGKLVKFVPATNIKSPKTIAFTCKRTPQTIKNGQYYEEGTISIATDVGNYDVFLPHDTKFSVDQASDIDQEIQHFQSNASAKFTAVNTRISGIHLAESAMTNLPPFSCGQQQIATAPLTYAMGSRDGTSCGVPNVVFVKTLSVSIPTE